MNSSQDYYTILGVAKNATSDEIKAAFKRLALKYHPDVYKGDDAHERMRLLLLAYKTLNDVPARREYDLHVYHVQDGRRRGPTQSASHTKKSQNATPGARRDRQRHYTFPVFHDGRSVEIEFEFFAYTLAPREARVLEKRGMLRGVAPETKKHAYFCHRCHYHWYETNSQGEPARWDVPRHCPKCNTWDWPEYLLLHCLHCGAVFESEQIRYEIGQQVYGKKNDDLVALCPPYELFPLCPYCGTAHWCPSEEERVHELQRRATYNMLLLRFILVCVVVVLAIAIGAIVLTNLH